MSSRCDKGYPAIPCLRPAGHRSDTSVCFGFAEGSGVYLYPTEFDFTDDHARFPKDLIATEIEIHEGTAQPSPNGTTRQQAIRAQKERKHARTVDRYTSTND
jgi:hypothetical protein